MSIALGFEMYSDMTNGGRSCSDNADRRLSIHLDDVELLRHHLDGNKWAFPELVRRYHRQLWWAIRNSNVPVDHHMDVLQEGLLRIHRFARKFKGLAPSGAISASGQHVGRQQVDPCTHSGSVAQGAAPGSAASESTASGSAASGSAVTESTATVGTWMVAIMRNVCHSFWKQQGKHVHNTVPLEDDFLRPDLMRCPSPRGGVVADHEGSMEQEVLRMDVHRALKQMNPELREVLEFTSLKGMSVEDYAAYASIPVGTVKSRRNRAKRQLEQLLNPQEYFVASAG